MLGGSWLALSKLLLADLGGFEYNWAKHEGRDVVAHAYNGRAVILLRAWPPVAALGVDWRTRGARRLRDRGVGPS